MFWLAFWAGKMGASCPLGIARFDPAQEKYCVKRTYKFRNFWTVSIGKELQKGAGDSHNKEYVNNSPGLICLNIRVDGSEFVEILICATTSLAIYLVYLFIRLYIR